MYGTGLPYFIPFLYLKKLQGSEALLWHIYRVGQNHLYTVYVRYFWQGNHQIYGSGHPAFMFICSSVGHLMLHTLVTKPSMVHLWVTWCCTHTCYKTFSGSSVGHLMLHTLVTKPLVVPVPCLVSCLRSTDLFLSLQRVLSPFLELHTTGHTQSPQKPNCFLFSSSFPPAPRFLLSRQRLLPLLPFQEKTCRQGHNPLHQSSQRNHILRSDNHPSIFLLT